MMTRFYFMPGDIVETSDDIEIYYLPDKGDDNKFILPAGTLGKITKCEVDNNDDLMIYHIQVVLLDTNKEVAVSQAQFVDADFVISENKPLYQLLIGEDGDIEITRS